MVATVFAWIVVALHVVFALMESVGWSKMARRFGYNREETATTRTLAMNQGAYNLGFAALLAWALVTTQGPTVIALLSFIIAMSVVGALTASWTILVLQGAPALVALLIGVL